MNLNQAVGFAVVVAFNFATSPISHAETKNRDYAEFGQETSCKRPRMKYQEDFKKLLKKLKPEQFGAIEYFAKKPEALTGENCLMVPTERPQNIEELSDFASSINASKNFLAAYERDIKCVLNAQRQFPDRNEGGSINYGICESGATSGSQKGMKGFRPCRTIENAEATTLSVKLVANCTGVKETDIFPLLQHESGFNLNAMSFTGAAGVGQMTAIALKDFKTRPEIYAQVDTDLRKKRFGSNLPGISCEPLHRFIGKVPKSSTADCEMIAPPDNPLFSLLLAAKMFRANREGFEKVVDQQINRFKLKFDSESREKLVRAMYLWSYNAGFGGALDQFEAFMIKTYKQRKPFKVEVLIPRIVTDKKTKVKKTYMVRSYQTKNPASATVDDLIAGMRVFFQNNYSEDKVRSAEVAEYYLKVEKMLDKANLLVGGSCFGSAPFSVPEDDALIDEENGT